MASTDPSVLLVDDNTGRAHAIADLFVRTNEDLVVHYGPGNDLIAHPRIRSAPSVDLLGPQSIVDFCHHHRPRFVFVAYAQSLASGVADSLRAAGIRCIGPSRQGAALEASKRAMKLFCARHALPTAEHAMFSSPEQARQYIHFREKPVVVKADGFTANSDGAIVCSTRNEALSAVDQLEELAVRDGTDFRVIVEERLEGIELSAFAFVSGSSFLLLPSALDFKRTMDHDQGKNCDGMGSVCPHPLLDLDEQRRLLTPLFDKIVVGLFKDKTYYSGFIYLGIMLTCHGPKLLEINCRFGDSEAEVILPGVTDDFFEICERSLDGKALPHHVSVDGLHRCSVALTQGPVEADSADYPGWPFGSAEFGQVVLGLNDFPGDDSDLFLAKVRRSSCGEAVTDGGRVVHVVGRGSDLEGAVVSAYRNVSRINFRGKRYRSDIGQTTVCRRPTHFSGLKQYDIQLAGRDWKMLGGVQAGSHS